MESAGQGAVEVSDTDRLRPVRMWLWVVAALVLVMVLVGGITRLTDSGLSITTWRPITGILPPLSPAQWWAEFQAYQQIPEFRLVNPDMGLAEFQSIYWWEWGHRFLGRMIGLAFLVPFVLFLIQRRLNWTLAPALAGLFVLGGLQGGLGWWMVTSGLAERTDVSQYRLAAHLATALALFLALIWVALRLRPAAPPDETRGLAGPVVALSALICLQIVAGAFVAGLDAGLAYNTWPLMDGGLVPPGLGVLTPAWRNLFENTATVQFDHRMLGYLVVVAAIVLAWFARRRAGWKGVHRYAPAIASLAVVQAGLGIATLVLAVPLPLAVAHQGTAFVLAATSIAYLEGLTRSPLVS